MKSSRVHLALVLSAALGGACSDGPNDPQPNPAAVEAVTHTAQFATVGTAVSVLPAVLVEDAAGNPVGGASVTFSVVGSGGTITGAATATDATGIATLGNWTLPPTAGANTVTAVVNGLAGGTVEFRATGLSLGFTLRSVAAATRITCGYTAQGSGFCWGFNIEGANGNGTSARNLIPAPVSGNLNFVQLALGGRNNCGLVQSGAVYCWGGSNGMGLAIDQPVLLAGGLTFQSIAGNTAGHKCGLTNSGAAYCWGENTRGGLGNGTRVDSPLPVLVSGGIVFKSLSAAGFTTCGIATTNFAYCWGDTPEGVVIEGSIENMLRLTPTAISGGIVFESISVGLAFVCGLNTGGRAYCWGINGRGQLGDGTTTSRTVPVPVAGGITFASLIAGRESACGLTADGTAYCWGDNQYGQLGDGTSSVRLVPVVSAVGLRFQSLSTYQQTCGVTTAGSTYCWGYDILGELGIGAATGGANPTPMAVRIP